MAEILREFGSASGPTFLPPPTTTLAQHQPLSQSYQEALQPRVSVRMGASFDISACSIGVVGQRKDNVVVSIGVQTLEECGRGAVDLNKEREHRVLLELKSQLDNMQERITITK